MNILLVKKYYYLLSSGQAKFDYSPLGKAFEKQTKTTKNQGEKKNQFKTKYQLNQSKN